MFANWVIGHYGRQGAVIAALAIMALLTLLAAGVQGWNAYLKTRIQTRHETHPNG